MSSGLRRMKMATGTTASTITSTPNSVQTWRHPMNVSSHATTREMVTLAMPCPRWERATARPRFRTNHRATVTFTTK